MSKLVIVESPTKARTIKNYLPKGYEVIASMGHIRDLPQSASEIPEKYKKEKWSQIGVNFENNFEPIYVVPKNKKKIVKELKQALKNAKELVLATDEDREGESISWHILELLNPKIPTKRMVFHEITKEAIQEAIDHCRNVDDKLVRAQETRRILDRLVGYTLSPLLWKKIAYGLSAGRVQSVAVRLIVEKERARRNFKSASYWDLKANLSKDSTNFDAILQSIGKKRVASGRDFDENTGELKKAKAGDVILLTEADAKKLKEKLKTMDWTVAKIEEKPVTRYPAPPFITSTLQQEANRKLGLSARDAMRTAQSLYENGFITYMRTDSVNLSGQAINAARSCVKNMYGDKYLSDKPRQYKSKAKGAQEAHEAIRPAGSSFKTPKETGLSGRELALYDLIWKRTVATQMAECKQTHLNVQIQVDDATFFASGKRIDFPGFFRAYVEGSDDPEAAIEDQEVLLPQMKTGDALNCKELKELGHETKPPARYTEASLVKILEAEGIGRPSTYASIIGTIIDRGYVVMQGNALVPTFTAFAVTTLLEKHFPKLVDTKFTANMEEILDEIAGGEAEWLPYLKNFYVGQEGLRKQVEEHEDEIDPNEARTVELQNAPAKIKIGRYGAYLETEENGETVKANIPKETAPADLDKEKIKLLIEQKTKGPESIGEDPETGEPIFVLLGAYGPYVQLGEVTEENKKPKRCALPKGVKMEEVTLEQALGLLSLPRTLGNHPETGKPVKSAIGRFGPFIVHDQGKDGKDFRSLKKPDDPVTITLERALEILKEPKKGRGRRNQTPIKELGAHPKDKEPVNVYDGPYGPYVKHKKTNASVPKEKDPQKLTLEEALQLLDEKKSKKK